MTEMNTAQIQTKNYIYNLIRNFSIGVGEIVPLTLLWHNITKQARPIQDNWKDVMSMLIADGVLDNNGVLSEKGYAEIYGNFSDDEKLNQTKLYLLKFLKAHNLGIGHYVMWKQWLLHELHKQPQYIKNNINQGIDALISDNILSDDGRHLTEKGYNIIYGL